MQDNDEPYVPLSERLNQDVWHDNFVPKYSALATASPSRLVLTGVWLLFGPATLGLLATAFAQFSTAPDAMSGAVQLVFLSCLSLLCAAILYKQTRRYLVRDQDSDISDTD